MARNQTIRAARRKGCAACGDHRVVVVARTYRDGREVARTAACRVHQAVLEAVAKEPLAGFTIKFLGVA